MPLASKNSEFDAGLVELESTERRFRVAEDAFWLMLEQFLRQGPQLREVEAASFAAKAAQAAAKPKIQSLIASE